MLKEERQALILNKLHSSGKVVVSRLAVELNVSEDTIRRDLLDLDTGQACVRRSHSHGAPGHQFF